MRSLTYVFVNFYPSRIKLLEKMSYPLWRLLPIGGTINAGLRVYSRIFSMYNDAGHSMPIVEIFYEMILYRLQLL